MKETEQLFYEENNKLYNDFLDNFFFNKFRTNSEGKQIELILLPKCNLCCKYCYVNKYYDDIYVNYDFKKSKENLLKILNFYEDNQFICNLDIFSGELLAQNDGYEFLDIIYNFFKDKKYKPKGITIPTNYTFILSDEYTKRVQEIVDNFNSINIHIFLSASFDGKYMEQNRPFKNDLDIKLKAERDDAYYEKVFLFNKKNDFGFHPMIYNEGIEYWEKNFNWFQEQYEKYNMSWEGLYLLQVRNDGWTKEQNIHFYNFIRYLITYSYNKCGQDKNEFIRFVKQNGFNLLSPSSWNTRQGMPCSIQSSLPIRISDLKSFPCHRLMYPELEIGNFEFSNDSTFNTKNAELGLTIYGINNDYFPICNKCPIREICNKGCLGSQFETNNDMFVPVQSVCNNYYYYLKAIADGYDELGILDKLLEGSPEKVKAFKFLRSIDIK